MKRVCIHQPDFLPHLGFFHRLLFADVFIILDDVQFLRKGSGWHNRDKIKTSQGAKWLTVSVQKGHLGRSINEVQLSQPAENWIVRNLSLINENYCKSPYFDKYILKIETIYRSGVTKLIDLNMAFLRFFFDIFGIHVHTFFASAFHVGGQKNQRLINLVKAVGGTHYLTGTGSKAYLDEDLFAAKGVIVEWQQFEHPIYPQLYGEFMPHLSCIDILFNCGPQSKDILWAYKNEK